MNEIYDHGGEKLGAEEERRGQPDGDQDDKGSHGLAPAELAVGDRPEALLGMERGPLRNPGCR